MRPITLVPPAAQIAFKCVLRYLATSTIFDCSIRRTKKHSVRLATRWDLVDRYGGKVYKSPGLLVLPNWREDFQKKNLMPICMGSVPAWHSQFTPAGQSRRDSEFS